MMKKLKKRILWLFACLSVMVGLFASCSDDDPPIFATVSGTVTDYETGEPLANATVTLSPSSYTQKTDATGCFRFKELEPQSYTIIVQKTGYQPNRKNVTAVSGEELEVNIPLTFIDNENNTNE